MRGEINHLTRRQHDSTSSLRMDCWIPVPSILKIFIFVAEQLFSSCTNRKESKREDHSAKTEHVRQRRKVSKRHSCSRRCYGLRSFARFPHLSLEICEGTDRDNAAFGVKLRARIYSPLSRRVLFIKHIRTKTQTSGNSAL